ncbi:ABC transporter substrate-binding protein [Salibacterium halotolerans]|uniref:Multiple sugar transport system substrate-binding protein n=1 Tax=Salibacterium halotolerans TaxID=1884432 RepID=A0A1I5S8M9_9BACI|nr:sugar ABC transporter substrate-binding protein [Salibacterium halotolerans]SFP67039.1 multiple sugar transport system substrate-binding protein [Salibacterium halotolerans]
MKHVSRLFILMTGMIVLVLAGCSGTSENQEEAGSDSGSEGDTETITLGYYSSGSADEKMKDIISQFEEEHPDITIETQNSPYQQFFQKLDTQIAGGNAPDIWLSDGVFVQKYAERGAAKDLTEWVQNDLQTDQYYGLEFNQGPEGKYWAVPQGIQIGALFYNKDMFDKAGVEYPDDSWTWEDLKEAGEQLTIDMNGNTAENAEFSADNINQYGLTFFNITEGWMPVLKSYGGGVLDEDLQTADIDTPENLKALEYITDGMERGIFTDPSDLQAFQSPMSPFPSETAAMRIGIYARTLAANETGVNYDVTVLPKGPDGERFSPVIANSWIINEDTSDAKAEAAWEWIEYWVSEDDVQRQWAELGEAVPVKKSVANSDMFLNSGDKPENKQAFLDSFEFADTLDVNAVWSEWVNEMTDNLNKTFLGEVEEKEALESADKDVQQVLDDFYED